MKLVKNFYSKYLIFKGLVMYDQGRKPALLPLIFIFVFPLMLISNLVRKVGVSQAMALNITGEIERRYSGKPLIVPDYASKIEFYSVNDFRDSDELLFNLSEVLDHEAHFTKEGIAFFEEVIGFEELSSALFFSKWRPEEFDNSEQIKAWLYFWKENTAKYY